MSATTGGRFVRQRNCRAAWSHRGARPLPSAAAFRTDSTRLSGKAGVRPRLADRRVAAVPPATGLRGWTPPGRARSRQPNARALEGCGSVTIAGGCRAPAGPGNATQEAGSTVRFAPTVAPSVRRGGTTAPGPRFSLPPPEPKPCRIVPYLLSFGVRLALKCENPADYGGGRRDIGKVTELRSRPLRDSKAAGRVAMLCASRRWGEAP